GTSLSRVETLVSDPREGRHRVAGPPTPRYGQCAVAARCHTTNAVLARSGTGAAADTLRPARTSRAYWRGARCPHAGVGRPHQSFGRCVPYASHSRWTVDGSRFHWSAANRTRARRAALGINAHRGGCRMRNNRSLTVAAL